MVQIHPGVPRKELKMNQVFPTFNQSNINKVLKFLEEFQPESEQFRYTEFGGFILVNANSEDIREIYHFLDKEFGKSWQQLSFYNTYSFRIPQ